MSQIQKQISSLYRKQNILGLLLFSLVTIIVWVSIGLITSQSKTSVSPQLQKLALPLTPTLNEEVIDQIEQKRTFTSEELRQFPIYRVLSSTPDRNRPSPTPTAQTSSLGTLTGAESASASTQPALVGPELTPSPSPESDGSLTEETSTDTPSQTGEEL